MNLPMSNTSTKLVIAECAMKWLSGLAALFICENTWQNKWHGHTDIYKTVYEWSSFSYRASTYASTVLAVVILSVRPSEGPSVCLSVTRVLCDKTEQWTADILIPRERATTLVFCHQRRLAADAPFCLKFALKLTHPFVKHRFRQVSACYVSTV